MKVLKIVAFFFFQTLTETKIFRLVQIENLCKQQTEYDSNHRLCLKRGQIVEKGE